MCRGCSADFAGTDLSQLLLSVQIMTLNESPAFLILDSDVSHQHKELPLTLYESGMTLTKKSHLPSSKGLKTAVTLLRSPVS